MHYIVEIWNWILWTHTHTQWHRVAWGVCYFKLKVSLTNTCLWFPDWWTSFWRSSCGSCGLREASTGWLWKGEGRYRLKHPSSLWPPTHRILMPSQSPWRWRRSSWRQRARIYLSGEVSSQRKQVQQHFESREGFFFCGLCRQSFWRRAVCVCVSCFCLQFCNTVTSCIVYHKTINLHHG